MSYKDGQTTQYDPNDTAYQKDMATLKNKVRLLLPFSYTSPEDLPGRHEDLRSNDASSRPPASRETQLIKVTCIKIGFAKL